MNQDFITVLGGSTVLKIFGQELQKKKENTNQISNNS